MHQTQLAAEKRDGAIIEQFIVQNKSLPPATESLKLRLKKEENGRPLAVPPCCGMSDVVSEHGQAGRYDGGT